MSSRRFRLRRVLIPACVASAGLILHPLAACAADTDKPLTEYTHTVWARKDGIPSAFIYALAQTVDGYLWLATTDGLVRFDGVHFVHWRPKTGYTELLGVVRRVHATADGNLWIGTASGLVGQIRGDDLRTVSVGAQPQAMMQDRDGTLWVATESGALLRLRATTREPIGSPISLPGSYVSGPFQESNGSIWLSTDRNVVRLDPTDSSGRVERVADGKRWLLQDASGTVHITEVPSTPGRPVNVQTVMRDSKGSVWMGTLGQGLVRRRAGSGRATSLETFSTSDGLSADSVWCLLEDREHNIWVGTQNGLNRFRDEKVTTLTSREGLGHDDVEALAAGPDGAIWAATSNGIHGIDGEHRDSYLTGTRITALHADRQNTLWAGTGRGIVRMQDGKSRSIPSVVAKDLQAVSVITGDGERGVWLVDARQGLHRFANGRLTDFSGEPALRGRSIRAAQTDEAGGAWFGFSEGGLVYFDGRGFRSYSSVDGLTSGSVNEIYIDNGTVWVATERGLSRRDGERFTTWNLANGLPGERVLWILTDLNEHVWLGYSTGVARLAWSELDKAAKDPSYRVSYVFLDEADGLRGNPDRQRQSPAVRASNGNLWFRTSEGVALVDPQHMSRNLVPPPVHIERMVADATVIDITQPIHLRPLTRDVEIDYTALSLAEPRNVRFRYKLEGFDPDWRDVNGRREAFYTNLRAGAYRFRVLASNNDGVWNEEGARLDITLLPAFYQTRLFLLLSVMATIVIAWGLYRLRVWQVTNRIRDRFEERLKERTRIAQELHDNLIQDVMGISLQIEVTEELLSPNVPARQPLERALRLCKSTLERGRRTLNDLRTGPLGAGDLVRSFSEISDELRGTSGIQADIVVEGREQRLSATAGHDVLQVGRQAIANAFQHSQAREIHVLLSYGHRHLRLRVQDNGQGMTEESLVARRAGHYGIAGMHERAERVGGSLSISSRLGEGTEVLLSVPAQLVYEREPED